MTGWILAGCAGVLTLAFAAMAGLGDLPASARAFVGLCGLAGVAWALAVVRALRHPPTGRLALAGILGAALGFRLLLLPTLPSLSTDIYRYLWDGRLQVAGESPYRYAPAALELAAFRDAVIYPALNHADWRTVYPPGAQLLFAGMAWLAPGRVHAFKFLIVLFDAATIALLLGWLRAVGRPPAWVLVYAWHPLAVVELAGSGHLDAVAIALSVAALWAATRGREGWAGALAGAGALVKLYPLLLLPALWRSRPGRTLAASGAILAAGYGYYARDGAEVLGSLGRYVVEEEFNPGLRGVLALALAPLGPAGQGAARLAPLLALAALAVTIGLRARAVPAARRALWLIGGYLVAVPSLFPWYALWLVPCLAVLPSWPWLYLTGAVSLSYLIFAEPVWRLPAWVPVLEFGPVAVGLFLAARPGGAAPLAAPRADALEPSA